MENSISKIIAERINSFNMEKDVSLDCPLKVVKIEDERYVYLEYCKVRGFADYCVEINVNNETVVGFIVDVAEDEYIKVFVMDNKGISVGDDAILKLINFSLKLAVEQANGDIVDNYDGTAMRALLEEQLISLDDFKTIDALEEPFWVKLNKQNSKKFTKKHKKNK